MVSLTAGRTVRRTWAKAPFVPWLPKGEEGEGWHFRSPGISISSDHRPLSLGPRYPKSRQGRIEGLLCVQCLGWHCTALPQGIHPTFWPVNWLFLREPSQSWQPEEGAHLPTAVADSQPFVPEFLICFSLIRRDEPHPCWLPNRLTL